MFDFKSMEDFRNIDNLMNTESKTPYSDATQVKTFSEDSFQID